MKIWKTIPTLEQLNAMNFGTIHATLGLEFVAIGDDFLEATLPVDSRTRQPAGLLHGGASAVLAESLGSVASVLVTGAVEENRVSCVGLELNVSHLRAMRDGFVRGRVTPIRIGRGIHVWDIVIRSEANPTYEVCKSRLTVLVREKTPLKG